MASPTRWTWVWVSFGSWWWTGKPSMLQSMGSQRVGHDWVTELNWAQKARIKTVLLAVCVCAQSRLCDPMDCRPRQAPLFTSLPRQEYWSGLPFPSLGDLPDPGLNPGLLVVKAYSLPLCHLAAAAAESLSRVRLCVTPQTAAHQAPPSLGLSRQEHWSGLPFPSPTNKSDKWKWSRSVVADSSWPHGLQPTRHLHPWDFPGKSTGVGCHCLLWWHLANGYQI